MKNIRYQKRGTKKLYEIIGTDLLTATERVIKGELGGFYSIAEDQAYFKTSKDKEQYNIRSFERKLRKDLHPNFFVVFNPTITPKHLVQGHQVGFYVPEYQGFIPLWRVGKSAEEIIPAESVGKTVVYKGAKFRNSGGVIMDEEATLFRGWIAAYEACKEYVNYIKKHPIINSFTVIPAKDFFIYKRVSETIGGKQALSQAFDEGRKMAFEEKRQQVLTEAKKIEDKALEYIQQKAGENALQLRTA